jgi:nucleoside-diphosphate-sugar epimerase
MHWDKSRVVVTGGASFFGSALVDVLVGGGAKVRIELHPEMPMGPMDRVSDISLRCELLGWEPQVKFTDGLRRSAGWYFWTKKPEEAAAILDQMLTERMPSAVLLSKEAAIAD